MAKYVYPAIFTKEADGYSVRFPDVPSCYTSGKDMAEAIEMAEDVLALVMCDREDRDETIPEATNVNRVAHDDREVVSLIACDTLEYRKLYGNKAVKKTLSIPAWLNTMSEHSGINFSAVLQKALKSELNID